MEHVGGEKHYKPPPLRKGEILASVSGILSNNGLFNTRFARELDLYVGADKPEEDSEFWLEDGNLTIIASNIEFRVYKGPIVANSPVFKSMLSLPQPDDGDGTPPNCICNFKPAVVHVSDSPEDLRHLLRALVPGKIPR